MRHLVDQLAEVVSTLSQGVHVFESVIAVSLHTRFSMELALMRACLCVCRPSRHPLVRRTLLSRLRDAWMPCSCVVFCNALKAAEHAWWSPGCIQESHEPLKGATCGFDCLLGNVQLPVVWLAAFVGHCVVKLLGGIVQCRAARHCRSLDGMARGPEHGYYCQAAWQSLCLHSAIKLLGGRVHFGWSHWKNHGILDLSVDVSFH